MAVHGVRQHRDRGGHADERDGPLAFPKERDDEHHAGRSERGCLPNFVAVDFYGTGDLVSVVRELNESPVESRHIGIGSIRHSRPGS